MSDPMSDPGAEGASTVHDPTALRLRTGLRVEVLDADVLALDPREGVVHRLEGAAAGIVADLHAGRTPDLSSPTDHLVVDALLEARIVVGPEGEASDGEGR